MIRLMTEHPSSVGESYLEHLVFATSFGASMIVGGLACCVHGVLPFLCTSTGSRTVLALHGCIRSRGGRGVPHSTSQEAGTTSIVAAEYVI
ncbi:type 1 capsular polysaccharide biosynthesis protein J [Skermanella aerolata]|uniref:Type 1 capsular polysaccharide biosynthesis protein J n=1 Tax=Skermanella aerolata TaxID=393310 RepID=A0A512E3Z3_9PROT|nr:DUF6356 family protein [Skermanella aerolata]GEO43458.1 type 1 capsular polysaccharide biosynthesis protein J [Skermanella aerolata]